MGLDNDFTMCQSKQFIIKEIILIFNLEWHTYNAATNMTQYCKTCQASDPWDTTIQWVECSNNILSTDWEYIDFRKLSWFDYDIWNLNMYSPDHLTLDLMKY